MSAARRPGAAPGVRRVRDALDPAGDHRLALAAHAVQRYLADGMAERAPAVGYSGILSLFPALLRPSPP